MKKFLVFLFAIGIGNASATTINLSWVVEGNTYAQTTCESGADLIIPQTTPTKRGYHFVGWTPYGYARLEYIESTGTQYIDTGIRDAQIDYMEMEFENLATSGFMFVNAGSQVGMHDTRYGTEKLSTKYKIKQEYTNNNYWKYTNITNGKTFANGARSTTSRVFLFVLSDNESHVMPSYFCKTKVYNFIASNNGVWVRKMVPVRRISDNEIGMYDTVTDTFFTNAGTGEFVAGPVSQNQNME